MSGSFVLRGATVVDGTGAVGKQADVVVADGRIESVGKVGKSDLPEIDLSGLVLAPGFIDPHTHFDAQVLWDRDLSPSNRYGVTSVVMGNCGYGIAPVRPEHRELAVLTLEAVEGMSREALEAGVVWSFETFSEYLNAVAASRPKINVGAMLGHSALRYYVMGEEASDRLATAGELEMMAAIVREALRAGALGFSTSRSFIDNGAHGKPVPSRAADEAELSTLMHAIKDVGTGVVQILPPIKPDELVASTELLERLGRDSGRPVTFTGAITNLFGPPGAAVAALELFTRSIDVQIVPQASCRPIGLTPHIKDPFVWVGFSRAFLEPLGVSVMDRWAIYNDPEWRRRAHAQEDEQMREVLANGRVVESQRHTELLYGPTLREIAEQRGSTPLDVVIDLSLEDDLDTRFYLELANYDEAEVGQLLRDPRTLLGLSDAGAHADSICDAVYPVHLLGHWVRDLEALSLEKAIWRMTGHPAEVFGISDRGRIQTGLAADLVAFDPETVGAGRLHRVHDLPAGADRLVADSTGIEHVWVNGECIRSDGRDVDAFAGVVLRANG